MRIDHILKPKKQTRWNHCWYASIQMLKTWKNGGVKTKPTGDITMKLHDKNSTLDCNFNSSDFDHVVNENKLKYLSKLYLNIREPEKVVKILTDYGPFIVMGLFGKISFFKVILFAGNPHAIVIAGIDTEKKQFKMIDPWTGKESWVDYKYLVGLEDGVRGGLVHNL